MGSCLCKEKSQVGDTRVRYSEINLMAEVTGTVAKRPRIMDEAIELDILELLRYIGKYQDNPHESPPPLLKINQMADTEEGWCLVMTTMIRSLPLFDPLSPCTITMVMEECPLPTSDTVIGFTRSLHLNTERCAESYANESCIRRERNLLVVLGCIADKFAGPNSVEVITNDVLSYLVTFLINERDPNLVLHSLITLEKFGRTAENKLLIDQFFASKLLHPLLPLEFYQDSTKLLWRQVGFCARWSLDNVFVFPGRRYSFETMKMDAIHAILNVHDVSEYLKISSDGLEARCDSQFFESVRATFKIDSSCWYYEAQVITAGVMQIGWATKNAIFHNHEGYGVGDDSFSLAYDGCRRLVWYNAEATQELQVPVWQPGDILGCLIDVDNKEAFFELNGRRLPVCSDIFNTSSEGFYAAASFMAHQQCRFNFGAEPFAYPPRDRQFRTMNVFGNLTDEEKRVIPRRVILEELHLEERDIELSCTICYDGVGNYGVDPCEHGGFCLKCVQMLNMCPMCRCHVKQFFILAL